MGRAVKRQLASAEVCTGDAGLARCLRPVSALKDGGMAGSSRSKPKSGSAKTKRSAWDHIKRTLSHRSLITAEALLLVGVADRLGRLWIMHEPHLPAYAKVLLMMALTIGIFGGLILILQRMTTASLSKTHEVVRALPLPTPMVVVHAAAFAGLFFLYAWALGLLEKLL